MFFDESKKIWRECKTYQGERYDLTAPTKDKLSEKIARRKIEIDEGKKRITRRMKVSAWSKEYMESYRDDVSDGQKANLKVYQKHIDDYFGNMALCDVKPLHCRKFAKTLGGYSASHAGKILAFARSMFDAAAENNLVAENPVTKKIKIPESCVDGERRALTEAERKQFLDYAEIHNYGLWIKVLIHCGLRSGETERMYGRHIDVGSRRLWVDGTKSKKAKRWVPIPDELFPALAPFAKKPFDRVFLNQRKGSISSGCRARMWRAFVRGLNIHLGVKVVRNELVGPLRVAADLTPHCLRHTFSSYAEERGLTQRVIADLMGHEDTKQTGDYTHMTDKTFRDAADMLNGKSATTVMIGGIEIAVDDLTELLGEIQKRKNDAENEDPAPVITPVKNPREVPESTGILSLKEARSG
jgi:integrase